MDLKEKVTAIVFQTIDELNETWPDEQKLDKSADIVILGPKGKIDSMSIVNLIMAIEEKIRDQFDCDVVVVNEDDLSQEEGPFQTVGTLINHITSLVDQDAQ